MSCLDNSSGKRCPEHPLIKKGQETISIELSRSDIDYILRSLYYFNHELNGNGVLDEIRRGIGDGEYNEYIIYNECSFSQTVKDIEKRISYWEALTETLKQRDAG